MGVDGLSKLLIQMEHTHTHTNGDEKSCQARDDLLYLRSRLKKEGSGASRSDSRGRSNCACKSNHASRCSHTRIRLSSNRIVVTRYAKLMFRRGASVAEVDMMTSSCFKQKSET